MTTADEQGLKLKRIALLTKEVDRLHFEQRCADYQCTVTQAVVAIMGQSLKEYQLAMQERDRPCRIDGSELEHHIQFGMAVPLSHVSTSYESISGGNEWVPCPMPMTTAIEFRECLKGN